MVKLYLVVNAMSNSLHKFPPSFLSRYLKRLVRSLVYLPAGLLVIFSEINDLNVANDHMLLTVVINKCDVFPIMHPGLSSLSFEPVHFVSLHC